VRNQHKVRQKDEEEAKFIKRGGGRGQGEMLDLASRSPSVWSVESLTHFTCTLSAC
jgi:hypothetical protein